MKKSTKLLLILIVVLLVVFPLWYLKDAEFGGADGQAEDLIGEISPTYVKWFEPILEPKSGEIESLLFALQAAFGTGIIFYYLGYNKGKQKNEN